MIGVRAAVLAVCVASLACASLAVQEHSGPKVRRPPDVLMEGEARAVELYQQVLPTVVTVLTTRRVVGRSGASRRHGLGTGVLISPEGHILTAAHVVTGVDEIVVKTQDGELRPAVLLFSEPGADVALLGLIEPDANLPHARLGNSDRLAVGQSTYIIGNPHSLENSLSSGHISGFREFNRLYDGTILAEYIQTDAALNFGNSGGPVFDSQGRVIGIASMILSHSGGSEGLGFVVAINTARQLLDMEGRAWIGIDAIFLTGDELARLLNMDEEGGLLIQRVTRDSPAAHAHLRGGSIPTEIGGRQIILGGDIILEFGGQAACHAECLVSAREHITGLGRVPVTFLREGRVMHTTVAVSSSRRNLPRQAEGSR